MNNSLEHYTNYINTTNTPNLNKTTIGILGYIVSCNLCQSAINAGGYFCGHSKFCEDCGITNPTRLTHIRKLEQLGYITYLAGGRSKEGVTASTYIVNNMELVINAEYAERHRRLNNSKILPINTTDNQHVTKNFTHENENLTHKGKNFTHASGENSKILPINNLSVNELQKILPMPVENLTHVADNDGKILPINTLIDSILEKILPIVSENFTLMKTNYKTMMKIVEDSNLKISELQGQIAKLTEAVENLAKNGILPQNIQNTQNIQNKQNKNNNIIGPDHIGPLSDRPEKNKIISNGYNNNFIESRNVEVSTTPQPTTLTSTTDTHKLIGERLREINTLRIGWSNAGESAKQNTLQRLKAIATEVRELKANNNITSKQWEVISNAMKQAKAVIDSTTTSSSLSSISSGKAKDRVSQWFELLDNYTTDYVRESDIYKRDEIIEAVKAISNEVESNQWLSDAQRSTLTKKIQHFHAVKCDNTQQYARSCDGDLFVHIGEVGRYYSGQQWCNWLKGYFGKVSNEEMQAIGEEYMAQRSYTQTEWEHYNRNLDKFKRCNPFVEVDIAGDNATHNSMAEVDENIITSSSIVDNNIAGVSLTSDPIVEYGKRNDNTDNSMCEVTSNNTDVVADSTPDNETLHDKVLSLYGEGGAAAVGGSKNGKIENAA